MVELALTEGYFEASPDAVVVTDGEGVIVLVNAQAEALFGYPRAELIGRSVDTLVPGRFAGRHPTLRQGYVANPRNRPMGTGQTLFARRKDGSELPVDISLSPFTASGKSLVICSLRDASPRVRAEAELRDALKRSEVVAAELGTFMESAPDGIVVADRDGRILRVNR